MPKKKAKKKPKHKQSKHRKPSSSANNNTSERVSSGDELPISVGESSGVNEQAIHSVEVDEKLNLEQNDDKASVDENLNLKQNDDKASVDENLNLKQNDNKDSNDIEEPETKPSPILADVEEIFEDQEEPKEEKEKKNYTFLERLLKNAGADVLRRYFRNIHPKWKDDANSLTNFDKGALKLKQHEIQSFQTGDTKKWDVSLLINVLRFTKISSLRLAAHPDHVTALENIREVRNVIISHAPGARLEDSVFDTNWILLKDKLTLLGATEDEVNLAKYDYSKLVAEQYLLELKDDVYRQCFVAKEKDRHSRVDINKGFKPIPETSLSVACTTWQDFMAFVNNFDAQQSHFVLLVDKMSKKEDLENIKVLSSIPWKLVLDFNPDSEDNGFHKMYTNLGSFQLLTSSWTPGTIKNLKYSGLPKEIDKLRTQWLFVNGRTDDVEDCKPKKTFSEWERFSTKEISLFFSCCSEMFDDHMSTICIILWLRQESLPFVDVTLRRLEESFNAFKISFCCISKACCQDLFLHDKIVEFPLTSNQIKQGVESFSNRSSGKQTYSMPTSQAGVSTLLTQRNYVYLSEHLQLFYDDCEKETLEMENEEQRESVEEQHRRSFLSGNLISPVSLHFHHDAERDIERDIFAYVQKILSQPPPRSTLISIRHSPGTGGSTIARRVLWDLRKSFPSVVVKFPTLSDYDESELTFIKNVCERISVLEEECGIPVLVLVDSTGDVGGVGNRIMRNLSTMGKKSLVLECLHWIGEPIENSSYKIFSVDSCLDANPDDLLRFKKIYNEFIGQKETPKRVFHFPLLSMITEFRPRLEEIVFSTLDKLDDTEREIVALVAFIHMYAGQPTPAVLICDAFKLRFKIKGQTSDPVTYDEIGKTFSDDLLNLMVLQNSKKEMYTLQHIEVSKLVFRRHLDKKKQGLLSYTEEFLELDLSPVDRFSKLYLDLLVFYKAGNSEFKFSSLFTDLSKRNEKKTSEIFCKAAEVVSDSCVFGNAARFHAKMKKPRFDKAKTLIKKGIEICEKKRKAWHRIKNAEGIVLFLELKSKRKLIDTIEDLEDYAKAAIGAFREARDFPPTFYNPLIMEVEVWFLCIEWIIKYCNDDVAEGIHFIHSKAPPFFRTCIGDSFTLLDRADEIIRSSEDIHDVEKAQEHSQKVRLNLVLTTRPKGNSLQSPRRIIDDLCEMFKKMPESSAKQMRRYKAWMMLSLYRDHKLEKPGDLQYLLRVLDDMVFIEKDYTFARHLLRICPQVNGAKGYDLARAMKACQQWLTAEKYDPLPYFYSMVIAFIQIINGNGPSGYFALYKEYLEKLKEKTRSHCRRTEATFFLGKDNNGMCQLVNRATLFENQQYQTDDSDVVKKFWEKESRQKLKECVGRIQVVQQGKRNATKVELLLGGGIKLHVKKNASLGIPGKDFDKEAKVYFVVSFTLSGVVANGITLEPVEAQ